MDKLRITHYQQLLTLVYEAKESGCYYGNKEQYYKRQDELISHLRGLINGF